ncbi:orotidine-5'-phosphate decarboxylase [Schaalia meyeri]|uniref:orotidine-5'-phosphate decarboxylase n=1 Tax=Schaalia meyeri TaxID=52773 RepID=UPI00204420C3|nr:orotidine-5'-phosphate decarboxylase [Schaalia meyeri]MCM3898168.1 orotidine-5'-phosphate decarboxylase [Schaalia meyeri]
MTHTTTSASPGFGDRLYAAMREHGPVCVGIDPHASLLSSWGLTDDAHGVREFSLRVIDALGGRVAAFKPQSAFFERHGSRGVAVLEEVIAACREVGSLSIVDAKRGDIGSTMDGYAQAYLSDSSPLAGDAVTLSPYLGVGSLAPALELARRTGRGVFVLALTSNPEGASVQHARGASGASVAGDVVSQLAEFNARCDKLHLGPAGIVVGATVGDAIERLGLDLPALRGAFLAPGVGAQGAGAAQVRQVFAGVEDAVLASSSRAILSAGPSMSALRQAYLATAESLQ